MKRTEFVEFCKTFEIFDLYQAGWYKANHNNNKQTEKIDIKVISSFDRMVNEQF
jgi:hypothetical protein